MSSHDSGNSGRQQREAARRTGTEPDAPTPDEPDEPEEPGGLLQRNIWVGLLTCFVVALGISAGLTLRQGTVNQGFLSGAAVLAFVSAVALTIERILEVFFTLMTSSKGAGGWWPLRHMRQALESVENNTNKVLGEPLKQATTILQSVRDDAEEVSGLRDSATQVLASLDKRGADLQKRLKQAKALAPGSARLALVTDVHREAMQFIDAADQLAQRTGREVSLVASRFDNAAERGIDLISSFQDNPARRIVSLLLGSSLGLLIAGFMGLNLFTAILGAEAGQISAAAGQSPTGNAGLLTGVLGVLITGIILGLGAAPTHEVIKAVQRYKESHNPGQVLPDRATPDMRGAGRPDAGYLADSRVTYLTGGTLAIASSVAAPDRRRVVSIRSTN